MGCAAFTPSLVGLASELEGRPFHLVASYNQGGNDRKALHEIFQNGLPLAVSNVTATLSSRHPGVTGITYVPYYLVFDQHGDLVYHHQGGPYHGGDRKAVLDRVRAMLEDVPAIYVGKEPYSMHAELAGKIESGKQLPSNLSKLANALEASPDDAELERLVEAVERRARNAVESFEHDVTRSSKSAIQSLTKTAKAYEGTPWGADLVALAKTVEDRDARKSHKAASKQLGTFLRAWSQLQPRKGNGGQVRNPLDSRFREQNRAALDKLTPLLESLKQEHGELPAGKVAANWLELIQR